VDLPTESEENKGMYEKVKFTELETNVEAMTKESEDAAERSP
jgi:hypothetical protein